MFTQAAQGDDAKFACHFGKTFLVPARGLVRRKLNTQKPRRSA